MWPMPRTAGLSSDIREEWKKQRKKLWDCFKAKDYNGYPAILRHNYKIKVGTNLELLPVKRTEEK